MNGKTIWKSIFWTLICLIGLVICAIAQVEGYKMVTREELAKNNAVLETRAETAAVIKDYEAEKTWIRKDLAAQLSGLESLLQMAEDYPSMTVYSTWKNEVNLRLDSIAMDLFKLKDLALLEGDAAAVDALTSAGERFADTAALIQGGIKAGNMEILGKAKIEIEGMVNW